LSIIGILFLNRLSELRQHKQKLSRLVRDKEEELEEAMSKIDILRQEVRRSEKVRRELESRLEESMTEVNNERKLREKNEEICQQVCTSRLCDLCNIYFPNIIF